MCIGLCLDCSYAGRVHRDSSSTTARPPQAQPANQVNGNGAVVGKNKGSSSVLALAKFLDDRVPFKKKV